MSVSTTGRTDPRTPPAEVDVVVVGAGFSGMYMLHRLRGMDLSAIVFEAGDDVGGTWYWNRYPGARVDVESLAYSYSFSAGAGAGVRVGGAVPDPAGDPPVRPARRRPLRPAPRHPFPHPGHRRRVRRRDRHLDGAHRPRGRGHRPLPRHGHRLPVRRQAAGDPRLDRFRGASYHTAHWPHEGVDFTGLRVGVIGTGSSGVQAIPVIAEQAAELIVFQRTPAYSFPARNRRLRPDEVARMKANYRAFRQAQRESAFGLPTPLPDQVRPGGLR